MLVHLPYSEITSFYTKYFVLPHSIDVVSTLSYSSCNLLPLATIKPSLNVKTTPTPHPHPHVHTHTLHNNFPLFQYNMLMKMRHFNLDATTVCNVSVAHKNIFSTKQKRSLRICRGCLCDVTTFTIVWQQPCFIGETDLFCHQSTVIVIPLLLSMFKHM